MQGAGAKQRHSQPPGDPTQAKLLTLVAHILVSRPLAALATMATEMADSPPMSWIG